MTICFKLSKLGILDARHLVSAKHEGFLSGNPVVPSFIHDDSLEILVKKMLVLQLAAWRG